MGNITLSWVATGILLFVISLVLAVVATSDELKGDSLIQEQIRWFLGCTIMICLTISLSFLTAAYWSVLFG